jgi:hypothetical protein
MRQPRSPQLTKIALAAAVTLVAILGIQNRSIKQRYNTLIEETSGPYAGLSVPAFDAVTLTGDSLTVGLAAEGNKQVLFFFAAACRTSRGTIPAWNRIATEAATHDQFSALGIQLDSANIAIDYPDAEEPAFPVLRLPDPRLQEWYRIRGVPVTVVRDHSGRVLYKKLGGLSDQPTIDSVMIAATNTEIIADLATAIIGQK